MPDRPSSEERAWLTERLADLAAKAGAERLVAGALVEDGARGEVDVLVRRLLAHAGMGELEVVVDDRRPRGASAERFTEVDYAGHGGGAVRFELRAVGEEDLLGALAIEVGKAFLDVNGFAKGVSGPHLGAIAAVYLGFGVPAANAAAGSLSESTLAYLVAVQRVVRGKSAAAYRGLRSGGDVDRWSEALASGRGAMIGALRLPPERDWPRAQGSAALPRVAAAPPAAADGVAPDRARFPVALRLGLVGVALAAAIALGLLLSGCDGGTDVGGSCEELVARWQTAVYQASVEACGGDGDCVAVGEVAACECTLSGADAVPRGAYDDQGGTDLFIEIARRGCRDDCQPSTPSIVARCVANRCQLDYEGSCASPP
ncbi:MAG TPA: hypothetical protein VMZ28_28355 [Kofleriaceae bacterium]|nr:hypothetical protein [Kofleriaceae bacterium]